MFGSGFGTLEVIPVSDFSTEAASYSHTANRKDSHSLENTAVQVANAGHPLIRRLRLDATNT